MTFSGDTIQPITPSSQNEGEYEMAENILGKKGSRKHPYSEVIERERLRWR